MALKSRFRHAAKTTTAAIGDFDRPLTAYIVRAAKDVLIAVTATPIIETETPTNWDSVIDGIHKDYANRINDVRRQLPKAQRAGAVAALKWERSMAIQGAKERRDIERLGLRTDQAKRRPPQDPTPQG